jgi:hypothetical protein
MSKSNTERELFTEKVKGPLLPLQQLLLLDKVFCVRASVAFHTVDFALESQPLEAVFSGIHSPAFKTLRAAHVDGNNQRTFTAVDPLSC